MHIVTKILVVLGAVLAILLSALTMAYSANADAVSASIRNERDRRLAAEADLASQRAAVNLDLGGLRTQLEAANNEAATLKGEIATLQQERAKLLTDTRKAQMDAEGVKNKIDQLDATVQTQANLVKVLNDELTTLRTAQVASTRRESELVDKINDLESSRQVLEQNTRALQEQLNEARIAVESASSGRGTATSVATPVESAGPLVQSRVTKTFKAPNGDEMCVIAEGTAGGLRANQKMHIVRNGQFVATLILTTVDLRESVGKIDKLGRPVEVMGEDLVLSRLD